MSQVKDTIKNLEELDARIDKAEAAEQSAIKINKDAAKLRDESKANLAKTVAERQGINSLNAVKDAEFSRKDSELKNREATLLAKQADLERKTAEKNKEFDVREAELAILSNAVAKGDRLNKEHKATLDALADKYKSISDFITTTL